jgi:pimeloyl-ACP methyl ester carboxylesterase
MSKKLQHLRASDVAAIAKLATQATLGVAAITEGVHQSVLRSLGAPAGKETAQTRGITGLVYKSVRGVTALVGKGIDLALAKLQPAFDIADQAAPETPEREAVLAALNGVLGDRLAADKNPLATAMTLRYQGKALDWQNLPAGFAPTGKILLLIHGLCMNDLQWKTLCAASNADAAPEVHDHGAELALALGYTPVYVRYNTGLHTSQNGHTFSDQLAQLVAHWPTPIEEITVVAHSMGGLVTRSAVHSATQKNLPWVKYLKNIIFLGTPHHGAPLERAGNWVDVLLGSTPYSKPFAKLAQLRSCGITDLRYGHVADEDWQGHDRFRKQADSRQSLPLPENVACFTIAATTAAQRSLLAERLIGDGLVPLPSALGQHADAKHRLKFAKNSQWIAYKTNHMQLLSSPQVTLQMLAWLKGS